MLGPLATWYKDLIECLAAIQQRADLGKEGRTPEWVLPFFCSNALLEHYQILHAPAGRPHLN
jgi:hypothetical protein